MNNAIPTLLLVFITAVWGVSFVLVKDSLATYGVVTFLALRFTIGAALMGAISARKVTRSTLGGGAALGLAMAGIFLAQTFGLRYTTVTNSGLITGLFVVFAPLANRVMFGVRTTWPAWSAIGVSMVGLALLTGSGPDRFNFGDFLTLLCAVCIGVYIALLDRIAKHHDAGALAFTQVLVVALVCFACRTTEPWAWPTRNVWFALLITGTISTAAGTYVQTYVQQRLSAVRVTVIVALTPVFAALFGYLLAGDRLTAVQAAGGILMIAAVMMVEVVGREQKRSLRQPVEPATPTVQPTD